MKVPPINFLTTYFVHTAQSDSLSCGEASLTFGHANANSFVFVDRIRNQFLKK